MVKKKENKFDVYYEGDLLIENTFMTEIPYIIVKNHMDLKHELLTFEEFKAEFLCIKEIISKKGYTQFILEEENIGDESDTSNTRKSNYINKNRGLMTYKHNGVKVRFGVWTQWKYNDKKSNFYKFVQNIKSLGYSIIDKSISQELRGDEEEMSSMHYTQLKKIIQNIIVKQNIKIEDFGIESNIFNNDKNKCFDMALIKKISGSNTSNKGNVNSNQSAILLTGNQRNIFPCVRSSEFNGSQVGKSIIFKLDLKLMSNNIDYLRGNLYEDDENQIINSYITTNETKEGTRTELGCKSLDDDRYVEFYNSLPNDSRLIIIKLKGKLQYVFLAVKSEDIQEYFEAEDLDDIMTYFESSKTTIKNKNERTFVTKSDLKLKNIGINKIYFGAPGTGKSKHVNKEYYKDSYAKRVTFHPEYTYNDFVGYIRPVVDGDDLTYKFVPGTFTEILVEALNDPYNIYTLIIEELNRANTAAVFGDLFQLLDRNSDGSSEYRVNNTDIYNYIKDTIGSNYEYNDGSIGIPSNLNIIATMNTADQNVFVMDTAFKRRWEFEYIPVKFDDNHEFKDKSISNLNVSWKDFVNTINNFMMSKENEDLMISEDKQIGPYFVKSHELNNSKQFGYKVLLYLWDDVFKMDKYKLFNEEIRTFSGLIEKFSTGDAVNIFNENVAKELTGKLMDVTSKKEENGNE